MLSRWLRRIPHHWLSLSGCKKALTGGVFCRSTLVGVLSLFLGTGVSAGLHARDHLDNVEPKLRRLSPGDVLDPGLYQFLGTQLRDGEQSAGRGRPRLRFLGLFTWLPGIGERIGGPMTQLQTAYFI